MKSITCDFCGAKKCDNFGMFDNDEWIYYHSTGKDECPQCYKKRIDAESLKRYNRIRISFNLPEVDELPKHE